MKNISSDIRTDLQKIIFLCLMILFIIASWFTINKTFVNTGYSVFVEFDSAYGIKPGTPVRLRGLNIGSVVDISSELNSVLAIINIHSRRLVIPKNSLIESNQTGLLNDAVLDILPLEEVQISSNVILNPLSDSCSDDKILCHLSYVQGDRGLNYDDLVRATTRISQRFDDPRFFNLFYMFLHNSVEVTDQVINIFTDLSDLLEFSSRKYSN
uniref:Mce/MlaD domain-containing protein n=1 Tax=Helminthocladia australis TaxID=260093 RepID=A0A1G4NTF4_9FLOR|nr:Hypothetical protein ycf22 [Helminthocladia australis]SCW21917.1 Hypothetical protein ycf22 [Helminthocladia australis]